MVCASDKHNLKQGQEVHLQSFVISQVKNFFMFELNTFENKSAVKNILVINK